MHRNVCVVTKNSGGLISKTNYIYTGVNQTLTIPSGATYMNISCWGAGGGSKPVAAWGGTSNNYGGGGGYTFASISVSPGQTYTIIVGQGGQNTLSGPTSGTYGGGSGQPMINDPNWYSASGGGRSAIKNSGGSDIVTAGGGGASGHSINSGLQVNGGAGGGTTGGNASYTNYGGGYGGTQTAGGASGISTYQTGIGTPSTGTGSLYTGGTCGSYGGAAGGGYYGGGSGNICWANGNPVVIFTGGGGGSSYVNPANIYNSTATVLMQANVNVVANAAGIPSAYTGTIGNGGTNTGGNGQNGLVIVSIYRIT